MQLLGSSATGLESNHNAVRDRIGSAVELHAVGGPEKKRQRLHEFLIRTETHFLLDNDLSLIPPILRQLRENLERMSLCDEIGFLRATMALSEALTCAIVQGNLEIDPQLSETDEKVYLEMIEKRRRQQPYADRRVHLIARELLHEARYVVGHEGPNFGFANPPDTAGASPREHASARAQVLLRMLMDEVYYNKRGNEVTLIKRRD
jgi:hypothetical protein